MNGSINSRSVLNLLLLAIVTIANTGHSQVIKLWEKEVPFASEPKAKEEITEKRKGQFRVTKVTDPFLKVFPANPETHNGKALIICPGGGYSHLVHLSKGKDIADYFTQHGFTCFVLYYQVPKNKQGALSDAKRAVSIVRKTAEQWQLQPNQIGMVGSSAGANLVARTSVQTADLNARPDFAVLLSTAYLADKHSKELDPEFVGMENPPPFFIAIAEDDKKFIEGNRLFAEQLKTEGLSHESHIYPKGGHGFGVDPENPAGKAWPPLFLDWLKKVE